MAFYVESVDRPSRSAIANEDIEVGEAVADNGSGEYVRFDATSHVEEDFDGVADFHHSGDAISKDDEDNTFGTFHAADNDRVDAWGDEDSAVIKLKTIKDSGGGEDTPSISADDVVGFPDTGTSEHLGRIVEEGWNDGTDNYDRGGGAGDLVAIGVADRDSSSSFDDVVRVQVKKGIN